MTADLIERTRKLTPLIEGAADRTEELGTMPDDVVEALADAGLFWILVPEELGGSEADIVTALAVFEELARADGSVGWSLMANATSSCFAAIYTGDEAAEAMFAAPVRSGGRPGIHAGMFGPIGTLTVDDGGVRVDGNYSFGSGCGHADWFAAGGMVDGGDGPAVDEYGLPDMRVSFLPRDQVQVTGNWDVLGLGGTGSFDYRVDDRHVDDPFTFQLLTASPQRGGPGYGIGLFALTAAGHAGFALGVGRRALDEVLDIARSKQRLGGDADRGPAAVPARLRHAGRRHAGGQCVHLPGLRRGGGRGAGQRRWPPTNSSSACARPPPTPPGSRPTRPGSPTRGPAPPACASPAWWAGASGTSRPAPSTCSWTTTR